MLKNQLRLFILLLFSTVSISSFANKTLDNDDTTETLTHNDSLALSIIEIFALDQGIRDSAINISSRKCRTVSQVDSICFSKAITFIEKYGWPTKKMLGKYKNYEPARMGFTSFVLCFLINTGFVMSTRVCIIPVSRHGLNVMVF